MERLEERLKELVSPLGKIVNESDKIIEGVAILTERYDTQAEELGAIMNLMDRTEFAASSLSERVHLLVNAYADSLQTINDLVGKQAKHDEILSNLKELLS